MDIIHVVNSPMEEETNCVGGDGKPRASVV